MVDGLPRARSNAIIVWLDGTTQHVATNRHCDFRGWCLAFVGRCCHIVGFHEIPLTLFLARHIIKHVEPWVHAMVARSLTSDVHGPVRVAMGGLTDPCSWQWVESKPTPQPDHRLLQNQCRTGLVRPRRVASSVGILRRCLSIAVICMRRLEYHAAVSRCHSA